MTMELVNRDEFTKLEKMTSMISNMVRRNEKAIADLTVLVTMKMKEDNIHKHLHNWIELCSGCAEGKDTHCPICNQFFPVK